MRDDKPVFGLRARADGRMDLLVLVPPSSFEHVHDQHDSDYSEDEPEGCIVEVPGSRHRSSRQDRMNDR